MKHLALVVLVLAAVGTAAAFDLGNRAPVKPATHATPPPPDPAVLRQGGDTILDAVMLDLNVYNLRGTTASYTNDYDEVCPYSGSTSPDVVYTFVPVYYTFINVDLFGSAYDTKIYIYDENLSLVACNDDYYADYTSRLDHVPLAAGTQYFLIIDGYGGAFGDYLLTIYEPTWCIPECPPDGQRENEPPLTIDYVDQWNGGCNTDSTDPPFQAISQQVFCGVSGWYLAQGSANRDTDWFTIQMPWSGVLQIEGYAWFESSMFELGPQDCGSIGVVQNVLFGPGHDNAVITITGAPGSTVWFWVGPTTFSSPDGSAVYEYDYLLDLTLPVAAEPRSWSGVKALFR